MTLRTVTYDTATHKIVPLEATRPMMKHLYNLIDEDVETCKQAYRDVVAAAPEYKESDIDKLINDLKASLKECLDEAIGWLDNSTGCTPEEMMGYNEWDKRARALLNQETTKDE